MESDPQAGLLIACSVIVGNLLTLLLIAGWRGYSRGRKTAEGAPVWAYIALLSGGLFAGLGVALFVGGIIVPML